MILIQKHALFFNLTYLPYLLKYVIYVIDKQLIPLIHIYLIEIYTDMSSEMHHLFSSNIDHFKTMPTVRIK